MDHLAASPSHRLRRSRAPRRNHRYASLLGVLAALASCRGVPEANEVEMEVRRVVVDGAARVPVVLLEDKEQTITLPIWIGVSEAQAIALEMEGVQSPRPLTHDLVKQMLERLEVEFDRAVITALREGTYYAQIHLVQRGRGLDIDSRPSDAIALAIRFRKPIFVANDVLEQQAVTGHADAGASASVGGLTVQPLSPALAEYFGLRGARGVVVTDVPPTASHGVRRGDVITAVDGEPVRTIAELRARLRTHPGPSELSIHRETGDIRIAFEMDPGAGGDRREGN